MTYPVGVGAGVIGLAVGTGTFVGAYLQKKLYMIIDKGEIYESITAGRGYYHAAAETYLCWLHCRW